MRFLFTSLWTPVTEFTPKFMAVRSEGKRSQSQSTASSRSESYSSRLAFSPAPWEGSAHKVQPPPALGPQRCLWSPAHKQGACQAHRSHVMRSACAGGDDRIVRQPGPETWPEQPSPLRQPDRALAGAFSDRARTGACRRRRVAGVAAHTSQGPCGPQPVHRADPAPEPARRAAASGPACGGPRPR